MLPKTFFRSFSEPKLSPAVPKALAAALAAGTTNGRAMERAVVKKIAAALSSLRDLGFSQTQISAAVFSRRLFQAVDLRGGQKELVAAPDLARFFADSDSRFCSKSFSRVSLLPVRKRHPKPVIRHRNVILEKIFSTAQPTTNSFPIALITISSSFRTGA